MVKKLDCIKRETFAGEEIIQLDLWTLGYFRKEVVMSKAFRGKESKNWTCGHTKDGLMSDITADLQTKQGQAYI